MTTREPGCSAQWRGQNASGRAWAAGVDACGFLDRGQGLLPPPQVDDAVAEINKPSDALAVIRRLASQSLKYKAAGSGRSCGAYSTRSAATFLRTMTPTPATPAAPRSPSPARRELRQQPPHVTLERVERRRAAHPDILRRQLDFTARDTVSRDSRSRAAIARTDMPSLPWKYLICTQSCTVITHPIVAGWPIFKEQNWPSFQRAPTAAWLVRIHAGHRRRGTVCQCRRSGRNFGSHPATGW